MQEEKTLKGESPQRKTPPPKPPRLKSNVETNAAHAAIILQAGSVAAKAPTAATTKHATSLKANASGDEKCKTKEKKRLHFHNPLEKQGRQQNPKRDLVGSRTNTTARAEKGGEENVVRISIRGRSNDNISAGNQPRETAQSTSTHKKQLAYGCTSLMYACQNGDTAEVLEQMRSKPERLRQRDSHNKNALHYCAAQRAEKRDPVAAASIASAAPELLESADEDGFTPLHLAVIQGNLAMVNLLLANKADVDAVDKEGHSVVHWATVCGEVEALRLVLSAGANVAIPDINGGSPLHYAAQMCGASYTSNLGHGNSTKLALEILGVLLAHPQNSVDVQDKDGRQPLLWAASAGSAKAIIALVQAGARVESADKDGLTALHCAASRGHTECIDTLVSLCGAPTDLIDMNGCTALHYAVTLGHADATARLLDLEADPDRQDRKGRTPAHCGCSKGQFETIKLLKDRGANLWLRNARGDLPVHEAATSGRRELVAWLLDQRPNQVNTTSNDGRSLLHIAAANDFTDMCKLLLDSGADIDAVYRNSKGITNTPLDCALQRGHRSTAKFLQANGGVPASRLRLTARRANPFREANADVVRPLKYAEKEEIHDVQSSRKYVVYLKRSDSDGGQDGSCSCTERTYKREQRVAHKCKRHRQRSSHRRTSSCGETKELAHAKEGSDICRSKSNIEISRRKWRERYTSSSDREHDEDDEDSCENCCYHKKQKQRVVQRKRTISMKRSKEKLQSDGEQKMPQIEKDSSTEKREKRDVEGEISKEKSVEVAQEKAASKESRPSSKSSTRSRPQSATKRKTPPPSAAKEATFIKSPPGSAAKKTEKGEEKIDTPKTETSDDKMSTHALELTDEDDQAGKGVETVVTQVDVHHDADEPKQDESKMDDAKKNELKKEEDQKVEEPRDENGQEDAQTTKVDGSAENDLIETLTKQASKEIEEVLKVAATAIASECKNSEDKPEQADHAEKDNVATHADQSSDSKPTKEINIDNNAASTNENQTSKIGVEPEQETVLPTTQTVVTPPTPRENESTSVDGAKEEEETPGKPPVEAGVSEAKGTAEVSSPNGKTQETSSDDAKKLREKESRRSFTLLPSDSAEEEGEEEAEQTERKSSFQILKSDESVGDVDALHSELSDTQVFRIITSHSSADGELKNAHFEEDYRKDDGRRASGSPLKHLQSTQNRHGVGNIEAAGDAFCMYDSVNGRKRRLKRRVKSGGTRTRTSWKGPREGETPQQISTKDQDSGFEPSPRASKTKIPAPRSIYTAYTPRRTLYTTLDGRSCSGRLENRKPGDRGACDMSAVTRSIQRNIRRYYMERKIFQHLLELKSLQIRSNKLNEAVLVKRAVDDYHKSCSSLGGETGTRLRRYTFSEYSFKNFELFLYETLKALQKPGTHNFQNINEVYEEAERRLSPDYSAYEKALHCTTKTHRCLHAIHAYTGIPCAAYIPMINHHTMPKLGFGPYKKTGVGSFYLPKILTKSNSCGDGAAGGAGGGGGGVSCTGKMALELTHGRSKQLISLPSDKLDSNKRYYVTFTVKESNGGGGGGVGGLGGCEAGGIACQSTADKQQNDGNEATGK